MKTYFHVHWYSCTLHVHPIVRKQKKENNLKQVIIFKKKKTTEQISLFK